MATTVAHLKAVLSADTRDYDRALGRSETKTQRFGRVAKAAAIGAGAAIAYGLGKTAKIGWDEFNQGQKVAAQTNAVLKSTGGVANVTAKHVEDLGVALMKKSGIDDEVIKSGQNMLLTFRDVRNEAGKGRDIFDQATKASLDLAVATGKDLVGANLMVGKALNDPIRGLTALRRVGVQFTESQEDQIKKAMEAGKTWKAQKIILEELRAEFGGSAEAAGQTLGGQINILRERFNNFAGDLVAKAIPYLQRFAKEVLPDVIDAVQRVWRWFSVNLLPIILDVGRTAIRIFRRIAEVIRENREPIQRIIDRFMEVWRTVWKVLKPVLEIVFLKILPPALEAVIGILDRVATAQDRWKERVQNFRDVAVRIFNRVRDAVGWVVDKIEDAIGAVRRLIQWFKDAPGKIRASLGDVGKQIDAAFGLPDWAQGGVLNAIKNGGDFMMGGGGGIVGLGRQLQSMGFAVGEHPAFGGVGTHTLGSYHYMGRALDINADNHPWGEMRALDWLYQRLAPMYNAGIIKELLWRTAGHFDHLHVAMDRAGWHTLRPGLNLVGNYTGRPEPVYATGRGGAPASTIVLQNYGVLGSEREVERWLQNLSKKFERRNGGQGLLG